MSSPFYSLFKKMEEHRKRPGYDNAGEFEKRSRTSAIPESTETNEDEESMMAWLSMDDETVTELSKLLETESTLPVKVKFIDDPYSLPLIFQSSSSYITINGNEESCGSSFSELDSSVMVGINNKGYKTGVVAKGEGGACDADAEMTRGWVDEEGGEGLLVKEINGSDCCDDYDDDMLMKFLGEDVFGLQ